MLEKIIARKDELNSGETASFYDVDDTRFITVQHTPSGRVVEIRLCFTLDGSIFARFEANRSIYVEQLTFEYVDDETGEQFRGMPLDWLEYMEECFSEIKHEA